MKYFVLALITIVAVSCSNEEKKNPKTTHEKTPEKVEPVKVNNKADLIEIKGSQYTEYYPDKKTIKFSGRQDDEGKRHGKWTSYTPQGNEKSTSMYKHGLRHGHTIVKYDNGRIHYYGEWRNDKKHGTWKSYGKDGEVFSVEEWNEGVKK